MCLELVTSELSGPIGWAPVAGGWAYRHPDGIRILVTPGEILVERRADVEDRVVRLFVLGIGFAAQLHFEGLPVLHATTVRTPAGDVAVVGRSGVGKSTVTAAMLEMGSTLVADDIAALDHGAVRPGFGRIKLWPDTARLFGFDVDAHSRVHPAHEKRSIAVSCVRRSQPLERIVVLERGPLGATVLPPNEALLALLANHRLPEIVGPDSQWLEACQRLVGEVEVVRLGLPGALDQVRRAAELAIS